MGMAEFIRRKSGNNRELYRLKPGDRGLAANRAARQSDAELLAEKYWILSPPGAPARKGSGIQGVTGPLSWCLHAPRQR
jgi:hypothetical protein